jgi:hypothetical protein
MTVQLHTIRLAIPTYKSQFRNPWMPDTKLVIWGVGPPKPDGGNGFGGVKTEEEVRVERPVAMLGVRKGRSKYTEGLNVEMRSITSVTR